MNILIQLKKVLFLIPFLLFFLGAYRSEELKKDQPVEKEADSLSVVNNAVIPYATTPVEFKHRAGLYTSLGGNIFAELHSGK